MRSAAAAEPGRPRGRGVGVPPFPVSCRLGLPSRPLGLVPQPALPVLLPSPRFRVPGMAKVCQPVSGIISPSRKGRGPDSSTTWRVGGPLPTNLD